jgi:NADH-quinone oxidoreductase subunit B
MGACASTGGVFDNYAVVQGIDRFIPVDVYIPGCPPRPEQVIQAVIDLQDTIQREGTIQGSEFEAASRQRKKRALVELPQYGRATRHQTINTKH